MSEIQASDMDSLYLDILSTIKERGITVDGVSDSLSVGSNFGQKRRGTRELIGHGFVLTNPRARLLFNETRKFDLFFAFGQFIWNIAGSDRLDKISFYNGKGIDFSDNGITIDGSCYGKRLFRTPLDSRGQIQSIVDRLKADPASRRTFAAIFEPDDNLALTKDVPCPIGVQYLIRNSRLHAITFMRSNSAAFVLPYNVFFFTMLQELIARELDIELGNYIHVCSSLHYYDDEVSLVEKVLATEVNFKEPMKPMSKHTSFEYLNRLIILNDELVRDAKLTTSKEFDVDYWLSRAKEFDSYWSEVAHILICHALKKIGKMHGDVFELLIQKLSPEYRFFIGKEFEMVKH